MPTSPVYDRFKSGEGYNAVPLPYTGTFMPPKPDLVFHDAPNVNATVPTVLNVEPSPTTPNKDSSQSNRPSAPIIEDWISDSEDESKGEPMPTQKAPSFVHTFEHIKTPRPSVNPNLSQLLASQITDKTGLSYDNQVFNSIVFDSDKLISSESDVSMPTSPVYDRFKSGEGYNAVPPPYTETFMPPKPDLVFHDAPNVNATVPTVLNVEPKDESKGEPMPTQKAPSFVHTFEHIKTPRPSVNPVEHPIPAKNLRKDFPKSIGHRHSWNRKACFVCKSLTHLIKDCDYYKKKMVQKPVRNHAIRGNHQHYARMTHPYPHRHVVPTAVLTRSRIVLFSAARPVTTDVP
nr:hypothetical protein [Tanacetum cinerariifolium]